MKLFHEGAQRLQSQCRLYCLLISRKCLCEKSAMSLNMTVWHLYRLYGYLNYQFLAVESRTCTPVTTIAIINLTLTQMSIYLQY